MARGWLEGDDEAVLMDGIATRLGESRGGRDYRSGGQWTRVRNLLTAYMASQGWELKFSTRYQIPARGVDYYDESGVWHLGAGANEFTWKCSWHHAGDRIQSTFTAVDPAIDNEPTCMMASAYNALANQDERAALAGG